MPLVVMSDLHLHDEEQAFGFNDVKERIFVSTVEQALDSGARILLAGDVFDLTGMVPPCSGLSQFFTELLGPHALSEPRISRVIRRRPLSERLLAIRERFPDFFKTISRAASQKQLMFIPGNHDCELDSPEGYEALSQAMEVTETGLHPSGILHYGDFIIAAHGHEFDPPNRTQKGCANPGAAITSALYCGLVPALPDFGMPDDAVSAIPAVRPEEAVVKGILHYLGPRQGKKIVVALVRLLDRSGYFRGLSRYPVHLLNHPIPLVSAAVEAFITPERLERALPTDEDLQEIGRRGARKLRQKGKVVVLGHTHLTDWTDEYVNLGTWIDHVSGLLPEDLRSADATLPVLRIGDDHRAELIDARHARPLHTWVSQRTSQ